MAKDPNLAMVKAGVFTNLISRKTVQQFDPCWEEADFDAVFGYRNRSTWLTCVLDHRRVDHSAVAWLFHIPLIPEGIRWLVVEKLFQQAMVRVEGLLKEDTPFADAAYALRANFTRKNAFTVNIYCSRLRHAGSSVLDMLFHSGHNRRLILQALREATDDVSRLKVASSLNYLRDLYSLSWYSGIVPEVAQCLFDDDSGDVVRDLRYSSAREFDSTLRDTLIRVLQRYEGIPVAELPTVPSEELTDEVRLEAEAAVDRVISEAIKTSAQRAKDLDGVSSAKGSAPAGADDDTADDGDDESVRETCPICDCSSCICDDDGEDADDDEGDE